MNQNHWHLVAVDSSGRLRTTQEGEDQKRDKAARILCDKAVKWMQSEDGLDLMAAKLFDVEEGGINIHMGSHSKVLRSSQDMFLFADDLDQFAAGPDQDYAPILRISLQGILRVLALCVEIVQGEDDASPRSKRFRWRKGVTVLMRMMNSLGVIGLMLFHAYVNCDYKLDAAIRGDASIETREAIADKAVEILRHELPTAWQDNVQLFYLPYAIEKILGFKYTAAKICESLGMENFSNAPIKSPFVKFEQLEPGGGFAILDAPERLETEERSELISMNAFSQETRETQNEFLMAVLSPDLLPIPNPLGNLEPYIKITISDELQKIALIAGEWPGVFGPVKSSTDSLHRLLWSSNHTLVVQMTIRFLSWILEVPALPSNTSQIWFYIDTS